MCPPTDREASASICETFRSFDRINEMKSFHWMLLSAGISAFSIAKVPSPEILCADKVQTASRVELNMTVIFNGNTTLQDFDLAIWRKHKEINTHFSLEGNNMIVGKHRTVVNIIELDDNHIWLHITEKKGVYRSIFTRLHGCWIKRRRIGPQTQNTFSNWESVVLCGTTDSGVHPGKSENTACCQHMRRGV